MVCNNIRVQFYVNPIGDKWINKIYLKYERLQLSPFGVATLAVTRITAHIHAILLIGI